MNWFYANFTIWLCNESIPSYIIQKTINQFTRYFREWQQKSSIIIIQNLFQMGYMRGFFFRKFINICQHKKDRKKIFSWIGVFILQSRQAYIYIYIYILERRKTKQKHTQQNTRTKIRTNSNNVRFDIQEAGTGLTIDLVPSNDASNYVSSNL